jgi:hypothetical protein
MTEIEKLANSLQSDLAQVDLLTRPSLSSGDFVEFLILKRDNLKLKIYQEPGHSLPHIHVDYGKTPHAASYGIDPAVRLVGNLSNKYDRSVLAWINGNRPALLAIWQALQIGADPAPLVIALQGDV